MKKITLSILFFLFGLSSSNSHVAHYDKFNYLEYELFRNNKLIGYHKYNFIRINDELNVKSKVEFKITKLGIDLYKYNASSNEIYRNNEFYSFSSKTKQNKKEKYVKIELDKVNNQLIVDGSSFKGKTSKDFIVGTWWNHRIVKTKAQISAISGRVIKQKVTFIGKEIVKINNIEYNTLKFNFSSSDPNLPDKKKLNTDIWYDEKTFLWIKASFNKQGQWEYRIKSYN